MNALQYRFYISYSAMVANQPQATHIVVAGQGRTLCGLSTNGWHQVNQIGAQVCGNCERVIGTETVERLIRQ
ncbi:MAG: hypothetical protein AAGF24_11460 [Cyanobacteria bacterium P01_H01_bin.121]